MTINKSIQQSSQGRPSPSISGCFTCSNIQQITIMKTSAEIWAAWHGFKILLHLFWQTLHLRRHLQFLGIIISITQFLFSQKKKTTITIQKIMMTRHLLGSVANKHVFLDVENKICRPWHFCNTTVLTHYTVRLFGHTYWVYQKRCSLVILTCTGPPCDNI